MLVTVMQIYEYNYHLCNKYQRIYLLFFCLKSQVVLLLEKPLGAGCLDMSCVYYIFATLGLGNCMESVNFVL